ncbi:M4 family metallopeptidase [Azospirillum sp. B2RO_4]|uniref:M4 family metallopeptidase n=1 Tax=Azospirillum sp. B2RO_4 TaxID=3027796 RepID=UPI003DA92BF6
MCDRHRPRDNRESGEPAICFIIPPHIQEHLAGQAQTPAARKRAIRQLASSSQVRGWRNAFFGGPAAVAGITSVFAAGKERIVCDAHGTEHIPGTPIRREGQNPVVDHAVNEAYDGSGTTYDFYRQVFERDSIDGRGLDLLSTVHYGTNYGNAFWNGGQMVYGDGDGEFFGSFTTCLDVIAHELTHGITQFSAGLVYQGQPGALNESFSDVFGVLVRQFSQNQKAEDADWLIGAGLLIPKPGTHRQALRSLKAPGTAYDDPELGSDPQPAHMKDYYQGFADNQGVHINSGIPNHAFYLAAMALGGYAWQTVGPVWYEALTTRLRPSSTFADAAAATIAVASQKGASVQSAVEEAWKSVGVI